MLVSTSEPSVIPELMAQLVWQVLLPIRHRISHVDLHPGNVLVDAESRPVLVDFDRAVIFTGSPEELRDHYHVRWTRAVEKHGLPTRLAELFTQGLYDRPACSLTCDRQDCLACPQMAEGTPHP